MTTTTDQADKKLELRDDEEILYKVESLYVPGSYDPTTRIFARMFAREGDELRLLGEMEGRRFEPYLLLDRIRHDDCADADDLSDAHDNYDQDTYELWSAIYDQEDPTWFCHPWKSKEESRASSKAEVEMPHGSALVLDFDLETEFGGSADWIAAHLIQAMLDQAEHGVNLTLVDLRRIKREYIERVCKRFAPFGFERVGSFLKRDPGLANPRICFDDDVDDVVEDSAHAGPLVN